MSIQKPARKRPNPGDSMSTQQPQSTDEQPTLAAFGTGTTAAPEPDDTDEQPSTDETPTQTSLAARWTDADLEHLYAEGHFPAEIAAEFDTGLTESEIRDRLRRAGVLEPHDDAVALAHLKARGLSNGEIAAQACAGAVSKETVRTRVERFGLSETDSSALLESMNPEDLGLSPLESEPDPLFERRGGNA